MKKTFYYSLTILFCAFLFVGVLAFWLLPDQSFSETENRSLASLPRFHVDAFFSGAYGEDMNDYFSDQFPLRDVWVSIKGMCELLQGKGENNGVLLGNNGQLAKRLYDMRRALGGVTERTDAYDPQHVKGAASGIRRAAENASVPFFILLPPRTVDVAADAFRYPSAQGESLNALLREELSSASYIDLLPELRERYENGEYVYYATDHHWTTEGAYRAYVRVMQMMGLGEEILAEDSFEKTTVATDFYGTFHSSGGMRFVPSDTIEVWYRGNEKEFDVVADGTPLNSFYNFSYLNKKDKYSLFLDGTHDVVTITKKGETSRTRLLIPKDSFANALAPFLAQHFDLVLLNLSSTKHDYTDLSACIQEYDADAVLLVYTLANLINTDRMNRLQ